MVVTCLKNKFYYINNLFNHTMDEVTFCSPRDYFVVNSLSAVLKDVRLSREPLTRLTLSARCLQVLYEGFRQIQSSSCVTLSHTHLDQDVFSSLTYLLNIVQNAKELKIFENGETLQGHVNCTDFGSISLLEVKCLPLYQLYGLSKVAANLTTITCIGCLTRIQELFEQCGADTFRASDVLWAKLNEVHLSYNNLQSLDSSLRLVSNLTHLDLSHNSLTTTNNFLVVLNKLKTLNLSYNSLRTFPEISLAAVRHLTSLNLRNNLLTSTEGLERLFCLQSLDLSNNLLPALKMLSYLKPLLLLQCLVLNGNPMSFHPSYRKIVINSLHPAVIPLVTFDGRHLTRKEKQQFDQVNAACVSAVVRSDFFESVDSASSNCDSMSDTQKRTHRRRRPRLVEIANHDGDNQDERFETSMDYSDSPLLLSIQSLSGHERDAVSSERCDSGFTQPRMQTSSRSSTSWRSIARLKHSVSATPLVGTSTSRCDGVRNNVEVSGNRICFVGTDSVKPLVQVITGRNGALLVKGNETFQLGVAEHGENKLANNVPGESREHGENKLANNVPGESREIADDAPRINQEPSVTNSDAAVIRCSESVSTRDSPVYTSDASSVTNHAVAQDVTVVVCSESPTSDAFYHPETKDVSSIKEDEVAEAERDACSSLHDSSQDIVRRDDFVSAVATGTDCTKSKSIKHDNFSSQARRTNPLPFSRSFSCASSQVNASRSYDTFRNNVFERYGGRSIDEPHDAKTVYPDSTFEDNSLEISSVTSEDVTLDALLENGFEGDFLIYLVEGPRNTSCDGKCIVSVIDNWLYVRTATEVVERLDLRNLRAVQKVTDHLSDFAAKRVGKVVVDPSFPGPVVRLLFDTFKRDNRERFFSVRDQDQGKQLARLLKPFIKTKNSKKMQCLRCDSHFDESEGTVVHKDLTETDVKNPSSFQAKRNSVMHCPKCDSHFVIEVSDKKETDLTRDSLTQSFCVKSETMSTLNRKQSVNQNRDSDKQKKHRRHKRGSLAHMSSSVASTSNTGSLPGSQSLLTKRRSTNEQLLLASDRARTLDNDDDEVREALPDDMMTSTDAVRFYFEDQNE